MNNEMKENRMIKLFNKFYTALLCKKYNNLPVTEEEKLTLDYLFSKLKQRV